MASRPLMSQAKRGKDPLMSSTAIRSDQRREILRQIGRMNVLAISGGRVTGLPDGVELPVDCGYRVRVRLTPADYYRVERVFVRGGKEFEKGHMDDIDCEQVANAA